MSNIRACPLMQTISSVDLKKSSACFFYVRPQEAEAFALYHKALDLQKHDKFEESAKAYHELLKTPLLKEVKYYNCSVKAVKKALLIWLHRIHKVLCVTGYLGCH